MAHPTDARHRPSAHTDETLWTNLPRSYVPGPVNGLMVDYPATDYTFRRSHVILREDGLDARSTLGHRVGEARPAFWHSAVNPSAFQFSTPIVTASVPPPAVSMPPALTTPRAHAGPPANMPSVGAGYECIFRSVVGSQARAEASLRRRRLPTDPGATIVTWSCGHCAKTFTRKGSLHDHALRHENRREYKCTKCQSRFNTSGDLKRHRKRMHIAASKPLASLY